MSWLMHRQTYNMRRTKSQNLNVSHLVLQFSLLKPGVKSRMLQLHLCDQQFSFLQRCVLYYIFNGRTKAYSMCAVGGIACSVATFLCLGIIITRHLLLMLMIYYANLVIEMCKCMYTPFTKWCILVYLLNVSWDIQTTSMEYDST